MIGEEQGIPRVEVRRYTRGFLHGKAYIPENDLAGVLAGSANLTYAGTRAMVAAVLDLAGTKKKR